MPQSFLAVARDLIESPEAKSAFAEDPDGFLAAHGLDELSTAEFEEAVRFVADVVPVPVASQLAEPTPETAPEPAALARLAATSVAEEAVREAEPGTLDLAAVVDPGGELDVQSVDVTTVAPEATDEPDAEAVEEEAVAEQPIDVPPLDDGTAGVDESSAPGADPAGADRDEADETEPPTDPLVEPLEPELQGAADAGLGDAGVPAGDAVPPAPTVETPPEDVTIDDLI